MARLVVSQNERILLHLSDLDKHRDDVEVPMGVSQEGMAQTLETQVHNISRALSSLEAEGLVFDKLVHVRGAPKRRRAYFLTERGKQAVRVIRADLGKKRVVIESSGVFQEVELDDAVLKLSALAGQPVSFFDILNLARELDTVRVQDVRFPKASRGEPRDFVEISLGRPRIEHFFGREKELKILLEAVSGDQVSLLLIHGMPGIGKSSLASRLFSELSGKKNLFWHTLREWDTEGSLMASLSDFHRKLGRVRWPEMSMKEASTAEIFSVLTAALSDSDAIVFLDDLHKSGKSLEPLLSLISEAALSSGSAKLVLISRSIPQFLTRASSRTLSLELGGLDRDSAWRMAESSKAANVQKVVDESHGHPLLLTLLARGAVTRSRGDILEFLEKEVSSGLQKDERSALELLSIFRHPVSIEALGANAGLVIAGLDKKSLVTQQEDGIWTHEVLRDFFSSRLVGERKAALHKRAAVFCELNLDVEWQLESLYHSVEAAEWNLARKVAKLSIVSLAKEFPQETLTLVARIPLDGIAISERAQMLFLRGQLREDRGDLEAALADYQESASILADSDQELRANVLESLASLQSRVERWSDSLDAHEKALRLYEKSGDKDGQAREWMSVGNTRKRQGSLEKARESYSKALTLATLRENRAMQAACLNNIALLDWEEGRARDAELKLKESVRLAHVAKDDAGEAKGLENLALILGGKRRTSEVASILMESAEAFRRAGELEESKRLKAACAESMGDEGKIDDGMKLCREALDDPALRKRKGLFQKSSRYDMGDIALLLVLIGLLRESGDIRGADKEIARYESIAESMGDRSLVAKGMMEKALLQEDSGDLDSALKSLENAAKILRSAGDKEGMVAVHIRMGTVAEKMGDDDSATSHYREALRHAELLGNGRALAIAKENIRSLAQE